jgi:drug/metabolite transporter (DMT)-like permease
MTGILLVALASFFWALDTLIRYPLIQQGLNPIRLVFFEHLLLVIFFAPLYFKNYKRFLSTSLLEYFYFFIVGGLGSALATFWFTSAFLYLNPSVVILLQKFQPLMAIFLARWLLQEKVDSKFLLWAFICFLGGMLISYPDLLEFVKVYKQGNIFDSALFKGYFLTLLAAASWGATTVFGKKLSQNFHELEVMGGRYLFGFITALFILGVDRAFIFNLEPMNYGRIIVMVLMVGLLSMYLYYKGLKLIPAKLCTLAEMFFPFCAVTVNWIFLQKTLLMPQIIGGIILLLGSTVIQWKRY